MKTSETIKEIAPALVKAQKAMEGAKKGASNPFFKSSYADYTAVLQACKKGLNDNGITILQPHVQREYGDVVETVLLHESGEWIKSETRVIVAKQNDPQALGSAITYARRYGLQSLVALPAEDDDGEKAMARNSKKVTEPSADADSNNWEPTKPVRKCPYCGIEHQGLYPKCIGCYNEEKRTGIKKKKLDEVPYEEPIGEVPF